MTTEEIKNGDIYDIGQTVNGVSRFMWFNKKWYYCEERMSQEYEYEENDLSKLIVNDKMNGWDEVVLLGNIFTTIK